MKTSTIQRHLRKMFPNGYLVYIPLKDGREVLSYAPPSGVEKMGVEYWRSKFGEDNHD